MLMFRNTCSRLFNRYFRTNANALSGAKTYEGEGKTSVHILNNDKELGLMINGVSQVGFRLNNNLTILGPMIIFPRSVLSWNIRNINDVNEDSLSLFPVLEPKVDILVLGIGSKAKDLSFFRQIVPIAQKFKLSIETLPTEQACATFNFLNSEGRYVVGALIPPDTLDVTEDDILRTKERYQNLYDPGELKLI